MVNQTNKVFFITSNFHNRDFQRYSFNIFKDRGYDPWICDVSFLRNELNIQLDLKNYIRLNDFDQLNKFIDRLNDKDIVLCIINPNSKNDYLFKCLKNNDINWGYMSLGNFPKFYTNFQRLQNSFPNIMRVLKKNPMSLFTFLINRYKKIRNINNYIPKFLLISGDYAKDNYPYPTDENTKMIITHSFDYDTFLHFKKKEIKKSWDQPYAIFIDQNIPYHSDYKRHNLEPYCKASIYYKELNSFFEYFEKTNDPIRVKILAHPKSNYNNNPFEGREIIIENGPIYIEKSELVFIHSSIATSFAILYQKPILFITSDNYTTSFKNDIIMISRFLDSQLMNISKKYNFITKNINNKLYENYIHQYIKGINVNDRSIWEKFCNEMEKMN